MYSPVSVDSFSLQGGSLQKYGLIYRFSSGIPVFFETF